MVFSVYSLLESQPVRLPNCCPAGNRRRRRGLLRSDLGATSSAGVCAQSVRGSTDYFRAQDVPGAIASGLGKADRTDLRCRNLLATAAQATTLGIGRVAQ